jgi:outer membrane PBP1 activator LpoA protein
LNNTAIPGASGMLRLSENQNIVRQLSWASIKDGLAVIGND